MRVFNLMQLINETRQLVWHETCKCVCRLTSSVCNSRQTWNEDKCRCECREDLIDKMVCDKGFIWNPSNCGCGYDKSCGIGENLDNKSCICRKTLVDRLIEEFTNVINENKTRSVTPSNTISSDDCASCTLYFALFAIFLTTSVIIGGVYAYFLLTFKKRYCSKIFKKEC